MTRSRHETDALAARLADYDRIVEIGIGRRTDVARALTARGVAVTATDVEPRPTPDGVGFVRDDVVSPDRGVYDGSDALYALNLPPELHRPALEVARQAGADFYFTTLGADQPSIPVECETIPGDTLYAARDAPE